MTAVDRISTYGNPILTDADPIPTKAIPYCRQIDRVWDPRFNFERRGGLAPTSNVMSRRPADSRPSPHSSRRPRTIIARRSSFPTGCISFTTPEGTPQSAGYTWHASMAPRRSGCSMRTVPPSIHHRVLSYPARHRPITLRAPPAVDRQGPLDAAQDEHVAVSR
jgi:hypothetical protein